MLTTTGTTTPATVVVVVKQKTTRTMERQKQKASTKRKRATKLIYKNPNEIDSTHVVMSSLFHQKKTILPRKIHWAFLPASASLYSDDKVLPLYAQLTCFLANGVLQYFASPFTYVTFVEEEIATAIDYSYSGIMDNRPRIENQLYKELPSRH